MLNKLIEWAISFWDQAWQVITWIFDEILYFFSDMWFIIVDTFLSWTLTIINSVDIVEITVLNTVQTWTGLPDQVIWILNYINLPLCLSALLASLTLRLVMNLIPASLTRV